MLAEDNEQAQPDLPQSFGYKTAWLALRADEPGRVAAQLQLREMRLANWQVGVDASYQRAIFVCPPVGAWVLVVGTELFALADRPEIAKTLLEELSSHFREAQFFGTHRVSDGHFWARAVQGRLIRGFGCVGCETTWNEGEQTQEERDLGFNFIDVNSAELETNDREREDLAFPNEDSVIDLAGKWSLNPTILDKASQVPGLGLLGKLDRGQLGL